MAKKVSFVVSHLVPTYGMEKVIMDVAELLSDLYETEVIQVSGSDVPNARLKNVLVSSIGGALRGAKRFATLSRMWRLRNNEDDTVYIVAGVWTAIPWIMVASKGQLSRTIIWEHSLIKERTQRSRSIRILGWAAACLYQRAAGVVGVSKPVTDDLKNLPDRVRPKRILTIHNPVETPSSLEVVVRDRATRSKLHGRVSILCVGSLTGIKRQTMALETLALLDDRYHLTLVGDGPERSKLQRLAAELNIQDRVNFRGYLSSDQTVMAMYEADILIHCSASETFGLIFAEAANIALPVVATRMRTSDVFIPKLVPGTTVPDNAEALADAIRRIDARTVNAQEIDCSREEREKSLGPASIQSKWQEIIDTVRDPSGAHSAGHS